KLQGSNTGFFAEGTALEIDDRIGGTIQIVGMPGHPVVLTALADDSLGAGFDLFDRPQFDTNGNGIQVGAATRGAWAGITLDRYSNDRNVGVVNERELPYGSQRLLEMARAVAAEPTLLLLDEPAAGLNTRETQALAALIARVRDELGITVGLVEHDMDLVMGISDAVTVLSFGAVLATGTPAQIQGNPEVVAAYLGD
ncbi:MAG: ABC transporter ATP-binding protein, partial [Desulfovibrio sp.]|nr:ABC transporter ATP-binding protein [Desulfovibrio sp.]